MGPEGIGWRRSWDDRKLACDLKEVGWRVTGDLRTIRILHGTWGSEDIQMGQDREGILRSWDLRVEGLTCYTESLELTLEGESWKESEKKTTCGKCDILYSFKDEDNGSSLMPKKGQCGLGNLGVIDFALFGLTWRILIDVKRGEFLQRA